MLGVFVACVVFDGGNLCGLLGVFTEHHAYGDLTATIIKAA
jgi:hypothetical protein